MPRRKQARRPGEGSVYPRKDGRWVCEITLEDHSRKQYYFKTEKEALDKQLEVRTQLTQGILATGSQQTVKQFLEYWLEDVYKPVSNRISTYVQYRSIVQKHLIPGIGHIKLQKLTTQTVQSFYGKKLKSGTTPTRVRSIHRVLHIALEHARRVRLVSFNVLKDVQLPKQAAKKERPVLTIEQAQLLLQKVKENRLEMLLMLALATAMREGELLSLRWSDVNFQDGFPTVKRTVQHIAGYGFVENEPKSESGFRKIVLPEFVLNELTEYHVEQLKRRLEKGKEWYSLNLVFPSRTGRYQRAQTVLKRFHKVLSDADLPAMRFHDLRHSAATLLLQMGVTPKVVQEILGHSNISITMNVYSHVLPSMQKEASEKMNTIFDGGSGKLLSN